MDFWVNYVIIGILATLLIDLWAVVASKLFKLPSTNWAMVGRWLAYVPTGQLVHENINAAIKVKNELALGWTFHYLIGIFYAVAYGLIMSEVVENEPTMLSAWFFGIVTVVSPWFVLQPGLGFGILASKTPRPNVVRVLNLIVHSIFGIGLFLGWRIVSVV